MMRFVVLLAAVALVARPAVAHCNYKLTDGSTLYDLAKDYKVNLTDVLAINPQITNPDLVFDGQIIRLPCTDETSGNPDVVDLLQHNSNFFYLYTAIVAAGLEDAVKGFEDSTVFAPTDDAFAALLAALDLNATALLDNIDLVTDVLKYHVTEDGAVKAADLKNNQKLSTLLEGLDLKVSKKGKKVEIVTVAGQAVPVVTADIKVGSNIVHVIDEVLLPIPSAAAPAPAAEDTPPKGKCAYTVVKDDTLFDIAKANKLTLEELLALNPKLEKPDLIQPKTVIKIC